MRLRAFFALASAAVALAASADEPCVKYDPEIAHLVGTMKRQTFPGRPNFETVAGVDRPETYWLLHVAAPVCVEASSGDALNTHEAGVREFQIVLKNYKRYRPLLGRKVLITGTLMHGISGHHDTAVIMVAARIRAAPR